MDADLTEFLLGDDQGAHLRLRPLGRDRTEAPGDDCLVTNVSIAAGGFSGCFRAFLRADELASFRDQLARLHESLTGEAILDSRDGWLRVSVAGNGRGRLQAHCEATDDPAIGNRLHFLVLLDQTYLPGMIGGLDAILGRFPVVG